MKSIYIIGNGFDLYHGLKTSYRDFLFFLQNNIPKFPSISNWSILDLLNQLDSEGIDLWTNFEEALGETDFSGLVTFYDFPDSNDLDEKEGDRQTERAFYLGEDLEELNEKRFYNAIAYAMNQWLEKAYHHCQPVAVYNELLNNSNDTFINFNYTSTLEDSYKIPAMHIIHIHGRTHQAQYCKYGEYSYWRYPDAWLDFGYRKTYVKHCNRLNLDEAIAFSHISELYTEFKKTIMKDCLEHFIKDLKFNSMKIIGHSLGNVDMPYFSLINKHLTEDAKITVFLYERDWGKEETFRKQLMHIMQKHSILFLKYDDDGFVEN